MLTDKSLLFKSYLFYLHLSIALKLDMPSDGICRRDECERVKEAGARVLTLDQVEGLKVGGCLARTMRTVMEWYPARLLCDSTPAQSGFCFHQLCSLLKLAEILAVTPKACSVILAQKRSIVTTAVLKFAVIAIMYILRRDFGWL